MVTIDLENREGLPDALRVLVSDYPRECWNEHRHFEGLVSFWLDRHLMFRRLLKIMNEETELVLDGKMDAVTFNSHLARYGGMFVQQLHGHHHIEDEQFFPIMSGLDIRLTSGFEILDKDHQALDSYLNEFTDLANDLFKVGQDGDASAAQGEVLSVLGKFNVFLNRHLVDEEELIMPIILKFGPDRFGG